MIVIIGKTTSGKTTVVNKLVKTHGMKQLITYTTRPMREQEKADITYHYISEEDFKEKIEKGFFAEWKSYKTVKGIWYYGTSLEDVENATEDTLLIVTPAGYRDIAKKIGENNITSIYVYANNPTIKKRLAARGDNEEEAVRRLAHDNADFKSFEYEADKVIYNNDGTNIDDVVNKVLDFIKEERK